MAVNRGIHIWRKALLRSTLSHRNPSYLLEGPQWIATADGQCYYHAGPKGSQHLLCRSYRLWRHQLQSGSGLYFFATPLPF